MNNMKKSSENSSEEKELPAVGFERYNTKGGWQFFLAGFVAVLLLGWVAFPMLLYSSQSQPLNFNHVLHMDPEKVSGIEGETKKDKCLFCHEFYEDGNFAGVPKLGKCMECHDDPESPLGDTKEEKAFMKTYVENSKEIPWLIYSSQPDCVYFSHISHVKKGDMDCTVCHGAHASQKKLPPQKKNRLTTYSINIWGENISGWKSNTWDRMKMDDCAECHTKKGREENNTCFECHK